MLRRLFALMVLVALLGAALFFWKSRPIDTPALGAEAKDTLGSGTEFAREKLGRVGQELSSAKTTASVQTALGLNRSLKGYPIDASSAGDVVTLQGRVAREDQKQLAVQVASSVPGVRQVVDQLQVDPSLGPPSDTDRTLGESLDDQKLQVEVKLAMSLNRGLDGADLTVQAYRRVVTLGGEVQDPAQKELALRVAREVPSVTNVVDQVRVRGQAAPPSAASLPPAERAAAAERALAGNPNLSAYGLRVVVEGSRFKLTGRVKTSAEKDLAGFVAREAAGGAVENILEVRP